MAKNRFIRKFGVGASVRVRINFSSSVTADAVTPSPLGKAICNADLGCYTVRDKKSISTPGGAGNGKKAKMWFIRIIDVRSYINIVCDNSGFVS